MENKKQELGKEFTLFRQDTEKLSHLLFDEKKREIPKLNFQERLNIFDKLTMHGQASKVGQL